MAQQLGCKVLHQAQCPNFFQLIAPPPKFSKRQRPPSSQLSISPSTSPPFPDIYLLLLWLVSNPAPWPNPFEASEPTCLSLRESPLPRLILRFPRPGLPLFSMPSLFCVVSASDLLTTPPSLSTPQNTPLNNAPISSHAQQPGVASIKEGESLSFAARGILVSSPPLSSFTLTPPQRTWTVPTWLPSSPRTPSSFR